MAHLSISIKNQSLILTTNEIENTYPISSATNGTGFKEGSFCTPTGNFIVSEKHGYNAPIYTVFKGRQPIQKWDGTPSDSDMILSRILWLDGVDSENINSKQRYIYIHGTNQEDLIGNPASCGCIRMSNQDVIELYNRTEIGSTVNISHY